MKVFCTNLFSRIIQSHPFSMHTYFIYNSLHHGFILHSPPFPPPLTSHPPFPFLPLPLFALSHMFLYFLSFNSTPDYVVRGNLLLLFWYVCYKYQCCMIIHCILLLWQRVHCQLEGFWPALSYWMHNGWAVLQPLSILLPIRHVSRRLPCQGCGWGMCLAGPFSTPAQSGLLAPLVPCCWARTIRRCWGALRAQATREADQPPGNKRLKLQS